VRHPHLRLRPQRQPPHQNQRHLRHRRSLHHHRATNHQPSLRHRRRPTTGANNTGTYSHAALGPNHRLPAADAPKPTAGNITLGYYDNDLARTIVKVATTTFTLDATDRRAFEASPMQTAQHSRLVTTPTL
jgi:hypothetical protein